MSEIIETNSGECDADASCILPLEQDACRCAALANRSCSACGGTGRVNVPGGPLLGVPCDCAIRAAAREAGVPDDSANSFDELNADPAESLLLALAADRYGCCRRATYGCPTCMGEGRVEGANGWAPCRCVVRRVLQEQLAAECQAESEADAASFNPVYE